MNHGELLLFLDSGAAEDDTAASAFVPESGPAGGDGILLEAAGVSTDFLLTEAGAGNFVLQES